MMNTQTLEINDFTGGKTDNYLNAPPNRFQEADNFIVLNNSNLKTRFGSVIDNMTNYQVPSGAQRIGHLINFDNNTYLFKQASHRIFTIVSNTWLELTGPDGVSSKVFTSSTDANSFISHSNWKRHTFVTTDALTRPQKIYRNESGVLQVRTAGLPVLASNPVITPASLGASPTPPAYAYTFIYTYEYIVDQIEQITYKDFGPTLPPITVFTTVPVGAGAARIDIASIPVLANSGAEAGQNFHVSGTGRIKIEIYRTIDSGTTFRKVGEVNNGTTTFSDTVTDAALQNNELLYTDGGVLDNDPPPAARFIHIVNDIALYGGVKEGSSILGGRLRQAIPGDPDSCPTDLFTDFDFEITGVSSASNVPLVFCKRGVFRINSFFDELGNGSLDVQKITDAVGCISHNSIVQTPVGVFFAGDDGFYFCDAYRVLKISDQFNETYKAITSAGTTVTALKRQKRIYGTYQDLDQRVVWSVQRDNESTDNDSTFVVDLRYGIKPDSCFTTWSGGTSFAPTALAYFDREFYRADTRGYTFVHRDTLVTDPKVNTAVAPSAWWTQAIVWDYLSSATNFGTVNVRKWVSKILMSAAALTNLSLLIRSINDDGRIVKDLTPIRVRSVLNWGDDDVYWGDDSITWNFDGLIDEQRRFPAGGLRCEYKQVEFTNANTIIVGSDDVTTATVDSVAGTAVLDVGAIIWPTDPVDQFISFAWDNYVEEYLITNRTDSTLTFSNPGNTAVSGSYKWEIKGIRKGEQLQVISYCLYYAPMTDTQQVFTGDTGANA